MVEHAWNPSTWESEAEDCEFKASLCSSKTLSQKNSNNKIERYYYACFMVDLFVESER
jgi:hypothetical protein